MSPERQQGNRPIRFPRVALLFLPIAILAIALYWPTFHLPLLYDDLLHIRIADDLDFLSVWLPTDAFGFYRPLTFLPLLVIESLFSEFPPTLLHGLNVLQHAANGLLLAWLSWRLWQRWHWAFVTGLLFVSYPFAYQAIAVYGHNVHPTIVNLLLLALHTYLSGMRSSGWQRTIWWVCTGLLYLFSLLSHESAIIFGFLAAGLHFNAVGRASFSIRGKGGYIAQPWFYFLLAGGLYFIAYQFLPLSRAPQAIFGAEPLQQKAYYLLQAAAYPLAWFGQWLPSGIGSWIVIVGIGVMAGLTIWSAKERNNHLPLMLGWSWWLLASLVVAIPLSASYLLHGPRLLYLSAAGIAVLWPVLLEPIWKIGFIGRGLWAGSLILVLASSSIFVRGRLLAYEQITEPVRLAKEVMQEKQVGEGILFINLPAWLTPGSSTYPIGIEITAAMADYLFIEEFVNENLRSDHPVQAREIADLLSEQDYHYSVHSQSTGGPIRADWTPEGSHIFITYYETGGPETAYRGQFVPISIRETILANFGPFHLLTANAVRCNDAVDLVTSWRIDSPQDPSQPAAPTTSIFVQELNESGQIISQADGPLLGLRSDLIQLPSDWDLIDRRSLADADDHGSHLIIGVYDYVSGERYQGYDQSGERLDSDALTVPLEECS